MKITSQIAGRETISRHVIPGNQMEKWRTNVRGLVFKGKGLGKLERNLFVLTKMKGPGVDILFSRPEKRKLGFRKSNKVWGEETKTQQGPGHFAKHKKKGQKDSRERTVGKPESNLTTRQ